MHRDHGGGVQRVAKVVHGHNSASYRLVVTRAKILAPDPDNALELQLNGKYSQPGGLCG